MTSGGWILMILSWSAIIGLALTCFTIMIKGGKL